MPFIKGFIEAERVSRRNLLLAGAFGVPAAAALRMFGPSPAVAATYADPTVAWSYRQPDEPVLERDRLGGRGVRGEPWASEGLADAPDQRGLLREVARGREGASGEDRRRAGAGDRHQRRAERAPGGRGGGRGGRLRVDDLEQDGRPAPVGLRRQLRVAHDVVGRGPCGADGAHPSGGDGRPWRRGPPGRHRVEQPGDRAAERPEERAGGLPGRGASGRAARGLGHAEGEPDHVVVHHALRRRDHRGALRERHHRLRRSGGAARRGGWTCRS